MKLNVFRNMIEGQFVEETPKGVQPLLAFTSHVANGYLVAATDEGREFFIGVDTPNFYVGFVPEKMGDLTLLHSREEFPLDLHAPVYVLPMDANPNCNKNIFLFAVEPALSRLQQHRDRTLTRLMNPNGDCVWAGWADSKNIPKIPEGGWKELRPPGLGWMKPAEEKPLGSGPFAALNAWSPTVGEIPASEGAQDPDVTDQSNVVSIRGAKPQKRKGAKKVAGGEG